MTDRRDRDELAGEEGPDVEPASAATSAPGPAPTDRAPYVDDRASKVWVAFLVAAFALVFLNALVLGKGGILTPLSPSPSVELPSEAASDASLSPGASPTASGASPSVSPSGASPSAPSPSPAASVSTTPAPSGSPAASPSPSSG